MGESIPFNALVAPQNDPEEIQEMWKRCINKVQFKNPEAGKLHNRNIHDLTLTVDICCMSPTISLSTSFLNSPCCYNMYCMYLGANAVITAVQQGADVPQVIADSIHRGIIFDVDVNECCDERPRQLLAPDHYILKTGPLHLLLKLLQTQEKWQSEQLLLQEQKESSRCTPGFWLKTGLLHSGRHVDEHCSDDV